MSDSNENSANWKNIAQFWQNKYQEQLLHFTQVVTVLSRSLVTENPPQPQVAPAPVSKNGKAPEVLEPDTAAQP